MIARGQAREYRPVALDLGARRIEEPGRDAGRERPVTGPDRAHDVGGEPAENALLKTLEEPPPKVKFFFATTELHKIPATIVSRCQRFDLKRIPKELIVGKLQLIAQTLGSEPIWVSAFDPIQNASSCRFERRHIFRKQ
jgi:DNA polymerase III delta prime subunit